MIFTKMSIFFKSNNILFYFVVAIFVLIFTYSFWRGNHKYLKRDTIFDISIITALLAVFFGRFLAYITDFSINLPYRWGLFPLAVENNQSIWFSKLPWQFFNLSDSNFDYIGIVLGVLIGMLFLYIQSNKQKSLLALLDRIMAALIFSCTVVIIGINYLGIDQGSSLSANSILRSVFKIENQPILIYRLAVVLLGIILYLVFKNKKSSEGKLTSVYLMLVGISETYFATLIVGYRPEVINLLSLYQVFSLSIIFVSILFLFNTLQARQIKTVDNTSRTNLKNSYNRRNPRKEITNFSLSFANRKPQNIDDLTSKEQFTKTINSIKRRIAK